MDTDETKKDGRDIETSIKRLAWLHRGNRGSKENAGTTLRCGLYLNAFAVQNDMTRQMVLQLPCQPPEQEPRA